MNSTSRCLKCFIIFIITSICGVMCDLKRDHLLFTNLRCVIIVFVTRVRSMFEYTIYVRQWRVPRDFHHCLIHNMKRNIYKRNKHCAYKYISDMCDVHFFWFSSLFDTRYVTQYKKKRSTIVCTNIFVMRGNVHF